MNDIYSFYQLISKYQIEIPIIQRDYAQGRNNTHAEDVRKSMVANMIKAVTTDYEPLFFDFIYGRIDGNKFIPFDGQQRLTTLFLFHKYVFEKCQSCSNCKYKEKCICRDILNRFSYTTRQSSREFCEKIVEENVVPELGKLSENVKNQSWFYSDWEKDPTIMGMLTMLDEIHNQLHSKDINFKLSAEKLTSGCSCPITFHFVDMGEHKLSDETYVKMNARGKTLTPFENFKASLEQYLENGKKNNDNEKKRNVCAELLKRFRGFYDEVRKQYTGIDGMWLDLFYNVINSNGSEKKELPDTMMLSFINRHFMNVWRCWYSLNTKSDTGRKTLLNEDIEKQKELDNFNQKIVAEMLLYPTKDDFVSWDIYQYVLDKCGVNECLNPIFNIWDKLYEENSIKRDCQAVWNREKESWNLYTGEKNNSNRETYPSRVAFYALLSYFYEDNEDNTSLARWRRVVWNIIENSTIDSPDTYHSALRLINKLSTKCYNIYDALANHFEVFDLGKQYHAQEQMKEEIAKANKIHNDSPRADGQSWDSIIIEAEKSAFFKGAIRFLFTNEKGENDWNEEVFDTKLRNAKKYFDEKGVKDDEKKYRTEALLLKAVLYNVQDFWTYIEPQKYVFDNKAETWKSNILLEKGWENAVHQILIGNLDIEPRENDCLIYRNLYNTNLLNYVANKMVGSRIKWIHDHRAIYPPYYEGIILDDENRDKKFYRNRIISSDRRINSDQRIEDLNYYKGWDIKFEYNDHTFQWNTDEKVYLLEEGKRKLKREDEFYFVDVTYMDSCKELIDKLDSLIAEVKK